MSGAEGDAVQPAPGAPGDSAARIIAGCVLDGFRSYRRAFDQLTRGARARFEAAAWADAQQASIDRIECYTRTVTTVADTLRAAGEPDLVAWRAARAIFPELCRNLPDRELAETFFNSIYCRLWDHQEVVDANLFVHPAHAAPTELPATPMLREYRPVSDDWRGTIARLLEDHAFSPPWQDLERDIEQTERAIREAIVENDDETLCLELLIPVFYRNKGAYLVGRLRTRRGDLPVTVAVLNDENGQVYVDNVLVSEDALSIVFSFTRSYFMVDAPEPARLVNYLAALLPGKKRFELYNAIGFYRHGKTEFYRDLLAHLDDSEDPFILAPGIRGMVMAVFTLPSYQTVFKIIKDRFPPQKDTTRDHVMRSYALVKMHDRVGRMADTQEFSNLRLPRSRFDESLIEELLEVAARSVVIEGDTVLIRHCYTERQMTPLNLCLEQADDDEIRQALDEYGNAIRQLAAANIFPGDMLLKNFGVTRHGRVVFYDYDEICYLTDVNFRHLPEPQTPEQEMASEPWYSVAPNDVFPEEFPRFMFANPRIKRLFTQLHGEIFDPDYWRGLQDTIRAGRVMDVFPYRRRERFGTRFGSADAPPDTDPKQVKRA
jgi:isocitrate dehydrogenase kinase/phosphatase